MTGDAHKPDTTVSFGGLDRFDRAALAEDLVELVAGAQIVELPDVEPSRLRMWVLLARITRSRAADPAWRNAAP